MDFSLTDEQALLRKSVREFAETEMRPRVMEWDEAQHFPKALLPKLADLGLMGIQFPEAMGGAAMSAVDYCICIEELARVDPSVSLSVAAHNGLGAAHISAFGSDAQKQKFLVPLATGEKLAAWGLTEPGSGSDAAAMRTTAVMDGDGWVLNGSKAFITHGTSADTLVIMAVTDKSKGPKGISAFIVERGTSGLNAGKKEDKLGMRASETAEVLLQNCRVPEGHLIGEAGQGFIQTLQVLDAGRIGIAALSVGLAQGAYEAAKNYTAERKQFGRAIGSFPAIQERLAQHASQVDAARLLTYKSAWLKDQGRRMTLDSAMAKLYSSEIAVRIAEDCVQMHGGYGFVKDYPAEKYFRDVKLLTIGEGTSEVQRLVIARQLLAAFEVTGTSSLAERVRSGDVRAMARAISLIEDDAPAAAGLVRDIFPHTGRTYLIGVTGPPGAGKSTLVDRLTAETRKERETVGVIAVDPTSPFTGGAILGDRVRMQGHTADDQVFIRSMATRGHMGGLARATSDAALVLDAAGKSLVIIETVGVGQDEVDIVRTADISIVVLVPGTGDDVQALKAGIMEIADIFVVNKCDRDGADRMVTSIESNLALQHFGDEEWRPPIVKTEATTGKGISELWQTVQGFRKHSAGTRDRRLKARNEFRLRDLLTHRFMEYVEKDVMGPGEFEQLVGRIAKREVDPYSAASGILSKALRPGTAHEAPGRK